MPVEWRAQKCSLPAVIETVSEMPTTMTGSGEWVFVPSPSSPKKLSPQQNTEPSILIEQEFLSPVATAMLASSDGGSVVVVVVAVEVGVAEVVLLAGKGERVVVVVALVASVGTVGCALSLLVAQAVAASAAMARTDTLKRCLIKLARADLMPSDDNAGRVGSQVRAGWEREGNQWQSLARPASREAIQ